VTGAPAIASPATPAALARRNRIVGFSIALAFALLATHWPKLEFGSVDSPVDKLAHAIGYGGLTALCLLAFPGRPAWTIGLAMAALGVVDELTQAIPGLNRACDPADWAADLMGITIALAYFAALRPVGAGAARLLDRRRRIAADLLLARATNWLHLATAAVLGAAVGVPLAILVDSWFVRKGPQPMQYGLIGGILGATVAVHALWEAGVRFRLRRAAEDRPCLGCGAPVADRAHACPRCGRMPTDVDWSPVSMLGGNQELRVCVMPVLHSLAALVIVSTASIALVTLLRLRVPAIMAMDTWYRTLPADARILADLALVAYLGAWALGRCRRRIAVLVDRCGDICLGCGYDLRATAPGATSGACHECGGGFVRVAPPAG
jgi:VanZ family protein